MTGNFYRSFSIFVLLILRKTGLVEVFLYEILLLTPGKTGSAHQRSKVVLHLESSPRIGDYSTSLIEHRRVTLLFVAQPFFATFFLGGRGRVTSSSKVEYTSCLEFKLKLHGKWMCLIYSATSIWSCLCKTECIMESLFLSYYLSLEAMKGVFYMFSFQCTVSTTLLVMRLEICLQIKYLCMGSSPNFVSFHMSPKKLLSWYMLLSFPKAQKVQ